MAERKAPGADDLHLRRQQLGVDPGLLEPYFSVRDLFPDDASLVELSQEELDTLHASTSLLERVLRALGFRQNLFQNPLKITISLALRGVSKQVLELVAVSTQHDST